MPHRSVRGRSRPLEAAHRLGVHLGRLWRRLLVRFGIGHRAAFLMGFGLIYGVIGLAAIIGPNRPDPFLYHTHLPVGVRVGLWTVCGAVTFAVANMPRWQWVGFAALIPPSFERLTSYAWGTVQGFGEGPPPPWAYLPGLALYALVLFVLLLCASWPDPPSDPRSRRRPGRAKG